MKTLFEQYKICAILRNIATEDVLNYAEALYLGGIRLIEVAMNTPEGAKQIRKIRKSFPDIYTGAGTVIDRTRCEQAEDAGAQFFLTPSVSMVTLDYCADHKIPLVPGIMTPSDIGICVDRGYTTMKLFPASDLPPRYIKSLKGPFDGTDFVAVGGVSPNNITDFFQNGFIGVGIGSSLVPKQILLDKNWKEAVKCIKSILKKTMG